MQREIRIRQTDGGLWMIDWPGTSVRLRTHTHRIAEAIGTVAILVQGGRVPARIGPTDPTITREIVVIDTGWAAWTVMESGRFSSRLDPNECLGTVASVMLGNRIPYGGLRTYEQDVNGFGFMYRKPAEIRGLLTA